MCCRRKLRFESRYTCPRPWSNLRVPTEGSCNGFLFSTATRHMVYRVPGWYEVTQEAARLVARAPSSQRSYMMLKTRKEGDRRNRGYVVIVYQVNLVGGAYGGLVYVRRAQVAESRSVASIRVCCNPGDTLVRLRRNKPSSSALELGAR